MKAPNEQRKLIHAYKNGEIAESVKLKKTGGKGASTAPKTKKAFASNGIKVLVTAKKKATRSEVTECLITSNRSRSCSFAVMHTAKPRQTASHR